MQRLIAPPLVLVLAAACAQPPSDAPPPPQIVQPGPCQAAPAQFAVGRAFDAGLGEQARLRAGATRLRVLRPGQMVTMEFDEMRLNLDLDASDRVVQARCG